jgi:hypothetical protein
MQHRIEHLSDSVTLHLGDCREILPTLGKVDAVVTDPPYGIAHLWKGGFSEKHGWGKAKDESITRNEWDEKPLSGPMLDLILAAGKQHVIWGGNYFDLPPSRCWFVWNKPERNFTLAEAELAWTSRDSVIRVFDCRRSDQGRVHPTQKPLELMVWCIEQLPPPCDFDPRPLHGLRHNRSRGSLARTQVHRHRDRAQVFRRCLSSYRRRTEAAAPCLRSSTTSRKAGSV